MYVQVLDENDNNPYFVSNVSNVSVMENSKIGTEITVIQAADSDSGDYGKITYLLDRISSQVNYKRYKNNILHLLTNIPYIFLFHYMLTLIVLSFTRKCNVIIISI